MNRRDEVPNQELAAVVIGDSDKDAVAELVENLYNKNKGIRFDCIKVLYEVGYVNPKLIESHIQVFLDLLESKDNRLQWGAMTAIRCLVSEKPAGIFLALPKIIDAANKGSVISRDHCVNILIGLSAMPSYAHQTFPLLLEQMLRCPTNQLPMYAEKALPVVNSENREHFMKVLNSRLSEIEKESGRKRIEEVLKKVSK
ncbi:MAG: hypothetical protein ABI539_05940 [Acidobacteriota bacterium]